MPSIFYHPYQLSAISVSTKTPHVQLKNKDNARNESSKKPKRFEDFLSDAEAEVEVELKASIA